MPLISNLLFKEYVATGLTTGSIYSFKVRARNAFGFSDFSEPVAILAAQIPDRPAAPVTTFDRTVVIIDWAAPFSQGSPITGYKVLIRHADGATFSEDLTNCDRLQMPTLQCTVPVASLKTTPFELEWAGSVWAKVVAINAYGMSEESDAGNGAEIITYPDAPVSFSEDFSLRTYNSVTLTWQEGAENGGSPVSSY